MISLWSHLAEDGHFSVNQISPVGIAEFVMGDQLLITLPIGVLPLRFCCLPRATDEIFAFASDTEFVTRIEQVNFRYWEKVHT